MKFRLDINSPETFQRFSESDRQVIGVKPRYRKLAQTVQVGDLLLAYVTGLSRWFGLFEVTSQSSRTRRHASLQALTLTRSDSR